MNVIIDTRRLFEFTFLKINTEVQLTASLQYIFQSNFHFKESLKVSGQLINNSTRAYSISMFPAFRSKEYVNEVFLLEV